MAIIKIPSSNIYGFGDDNSLLVKNKISQAALSVNDFVKQQGNISESFIATYYIWDEETMDSPRFVGEDPSYNSFEFEKVSMGLYRKGVYSPNDATIEFAKPAKITNLSPNTSGNIEGYNVVRNQKWLIIDFPITPDDPTFNQNITTEAKTIVPPTKIFYDHNKNHLQINLNLNVYYTEYHTQHGTFIYDKLFDVDPDGKIGQEIFLLSETIEVQGLYYSPKNILQKYGEGTNSITLPSNELIQDDSLLYDSKLSEKLLESVVNRYSNGKEVYEIKCSLADYYASYATNKLLVISPTTTFLPSTFKKYDIVEPYVYTSQGEVPLSTKPDGTPKRFEVIGIDFDYKGVVWQKITIQENNDTRQAIITSIDSSYLESSITITFVSGMNWKDWVDSEDGILYGAYFESDEQIRLLINETDTVLTIESQSEELVDGKQYYGYPY